MEDISHSDVQFDDEKWVQGRKTKRTIWQLVPVEMSLRTAMKLIRKMQQRGCGLCQQTPNVLNMIFLVILYDLIVLHQWADCGKHDLQEAKKLEVG